MSASIVSNETLTKFFIAAVFITLATLLIMGVIPAP